MGGRGAKGGKVKEGGGSQDQGSMARYAEKGESGYAYLKSQKELTNLTDELADLKTKQKNLYNRAAMASGNYQAEIAKDINKNERRQATVSRKIGETKAKIGGYTYKASADIEREISWQERKIDGSRNQGKEGTPYYKGLVNNLNRLKGELQTAKGRGD